MTKLREGWAERVVVGGGLLLTGALVVSAAGAWIQQVRPTQPSGAVAVTARIDDAKAERGRAAVVRMERERQSALSANAARYRISLELAASIYDIAKREHVDPAIGYRLVQIESNFKPRARSSAGALGLTQIQIGTARQYESHVTEARLLERDANLALGFRYLRDLMVQFDNDSHLALLAYNRGPGRVEEILAEGGNPRNGYSSAVLKGYKASAPVRGIAN